jgi:IMP dehydrogenase
MRQISKLINNKRAISYDDILIVPDGSIVHSRDDVNTTVFLPKDYTLELPIFVAAMDTLTSADMATVALDYGAGIFHHKNQDIETLIATLEVNRTHVNIVDKKAIQGVSIALDTPNEHILSCIAHGANAVLLEFSQIRLESVINPQRIKEIYSLCNDKNVLFVLGNIANAVTDVYWIKSELNDCADILKVGYGFGSAGTSRFVSGVGYPTLQLLLDSHESSAHMYYPMIADGGIKSPGDLCKAIAAGAIAGCAGSIFAGTLETPGPIKKNLNHGNDMLPKMYKEFWGMSSPQGRRGASGNARNAGYVQGGSGICPLRGSARIYFDRFRDGLKSAIASTGCANISDFQEHSKFVLVSANSSKNINTID